jgi:flagellar basal body-associated protein FliL
VVRVFLLFLMVFAIGGAVAGVITYLRLQPSAEQTAAAPARTDVAFIELDAVNVPIKRDDDARETRTYVFVLEASRKNQNLVLQHRLKLRDTYTKYLTVLAERAENVDPDRAPHLETIENIDYLKRQLTAAANDMMGANVIQGVLIRQILSNVSG